MTRLARVSFVQNPATIKRNMHMHGAGCEGNQGPLCVCHLHRTPVVSCLGPVIPDLSAHRAVFRTQHRDGPATGNQWLFAELEGEA